MSVITHAYTGILLNGQNKRLFCFLGCNVLKVTNGLML
jgi:hypothetical protein